MGLGEAMEQRWRGEGNVVAAIASLFCGTAGRRARDESINAETIDFAAFLPATHQE